MVLFISNVDILVNLKVVNIINVEVLLKKTSQIRRYDEATTPLGLGPFALVSFVI